MLSFSGDHTGPPTGCTPQELGVLRTLGGWLPHLFREGWVFKDVVEVHWYKVTSRGS